MQSTIHEVGEHHFVDAVCAMICQTAAGSTISAMKNNAKANIMAGEKHLRKGGAGGWRDTFTVRESEEFDKIYLEQMEGSGLEMDFGEGLVM